MLSDRTFSTRAAGGNPGNCMAWSRRKQRFVHGLIVARRHDTFDRHASEPFGSGSPGAALSEIFFSYSSHDRERVRPYHDALTALGFDVFWDAQVPTAADWDRMIKGKLEQSRCAIVFWSTNAAASPNVRHEVDIARGDRKLVQVLLEPMSTKALPMGSIAEQVLRHATCPVLTVHLPPDA